MSSELDALRARVSANDGVIVAAMNERLRLVAELWHLKREIGADRVDPQRERRLRDELRALNAGPLSEKGVDRLVAELLALTKSELG